MNQRYWQRIDSLKTCHTSITKFLLILFTYDLPHSTKDFKTLKGDYLGQKEGGESKKEEGRGERGGGGKGERCHFHSCHLATLHLTTSYHPPKVWPLV